MTPNETYATLYNEKVDLKGGVNPVHAAGLQRVADHVEGIWRGRADYLEKVLENAIDFWADVSEGRNLDRADLFILSKAHVAILRKALEESRTL